jgi:hypothetical protein
MHNEAGIDPNNPRHLYDGLHPADSGGRRMAEVWYNHIIPVIDSGGNRLPVSEANGPYVGAINGTISFSSQGSHDPDGRIRSYAWRFGNGDSSTAANPQYAYQSAGIYKIWLTITDSAGAAAADSAIAIIGDIALNKPVVSENNEGPEYLAGNAVDTSLTSFWGASPSPQWWQVDLESVYDISRIIIRNYVDGNRCYQYDIVASENNQDWTTIASKTTSDPATDAGDSYAVKVRARFLRVTMNRNSANIGVHISNFHVEGVPIVGADPWKAPEPKGFVKPVLNIRGSTITISGISSHQEAVSLRLLDCAGRCLVNERLRPVASSICLDLGRYGRRAGVFLADVRTAETRMIFNHLSIR